MSDRKLKAAQLQLGFPKSPKPKINMHPQTESELLENARLRSRFARADVERIHEALKRMADHTDDPASFFREMLKKLNIRTPRVNLENIRLFEVDFMAHLRANGMAKLPSSKIASTIEYIIDSLGGSTIPVRMSRQEWTGDQYGDLGEDGSYRDALKRQEDQ